MGGCDNMNSPIFSIIIPHKNCPILLQRCINTIPSSTDIQVIIVDDNSTDEIVDFSNFPGMKRHNIEVYFTNEGKGAGYARNVGIQHAKGKWLLFADADDYFTEDFYSIISEYSSYDGDIVFFSATSIYPETNEEANRHCLINESIQSYLKGDDTQLRYHRASPIAKMIKRELIESYNIRFDEVIASNDTLFSLKSGHFAKKILADERVIYVITVRFGSLEYTYSKDVLLSRIGVDYRVNDFLKLHKINYRIRIIRYIILLRFVSKILFLRELFKYIFTRPFYAINDLVYYCSQIKFHCKKRSDINDYYIKVEK